jgi:diadenosine tetraphosphate (Ap4A) HIT family hydrolase/5-methylcytosine-specific restriction endonuclease McrA
MDYEQLINFLSKDMRMSHVYQPVMIRVLLGSGGRSSVESIARALLNEDRSQIEYYEAIVKNMVGRVLTNRGVARRDGSDYQLVDAEKLTPEQVAELRAVCEAKAAEYIARRGDAIWEHRSRGLRDIGGTLKYEVLKAAKFRCELCGVPADERALEVDHIRPRNHDGTDDPSNLQALCYSCNSMKRDRDDTDFRAVRAAYEQREADCPFCHLGGREVLLENPLAVVLRDQYPVTQHHLLVIPKRHVSDFFDLGTAESRACEDLLRRARKLVGEWDPQVTGANIGVNSGVSAGQTVMHCHIHLIPRRDGDVERPRGGVRAVVPGKTDYLEG